MPIDLRMQYERSELASPLWCDHKSLISWPINYRVRVFPVNFIDVETFSVAYIHCTNMVEQSSKLYFCQRGEPVRIRKWHDRSSTVYVKANLSTNAPFSHMFQLQSQLMNVITYIIKCGMKLIVHYVEVWGRMSNFIRHFIIYLPISPLELKHVSKKSPWQEQRLQLYKQSWKLSDLYYQVYAILLYRCFRTCEHGWIQSFNG